MKHIFDPTFKYYNSSDTDLRRTFNRIREEEAAIQRAADESSMYDREPRKRLNHDERLDDPRHGQVLELNRRR